jgi:ABC-type lipoprotein release transport system permease subunit
MVYTLKDTTKTTTTTTTTVMMVVVVVVVMMMMMMMMKSFKHYNESMTLCLTPSCGDYDNKKYAEKYP